MAEVTFSDHVDLEGTRRVKNAPAPGAATDLDRVQDRDAAITAAIADKLGPVTGAPDGTKFLRDDLSWQTAAATVPDADGSTKGKVQLAGDLGGTAAAPTVPGLAGKADASALTSHTGDTGNPHAVTKAQVGLGSVTNDPQLKAADLDTDSTFAANSDTRVPSQKAVKTAVDGKLSAGGDTTTGAIRFTPVALTDAATIALDAQLGNTFEVTLAGNRTLGTPSNPPGAGEAQEFRLYVKQDATGGRTLGYSSAYEFSTDLPVPVLTGTGNAVDVLAFRYRAGSGKWLLIGINQGFGDV